jgi:20S proteasome subunit alpha 3
LESIKKSDPALGILCKDGIVIACERASSSTLLEQSKHSEKVYKLDNHIYAVVSGMTADSNYLVDFAREAGQKFAMTLRNPIPVE